MSKYTLPSGIVRGVFDALPAMNDMEPHSSDPDTEGTDQDDDNVGVAKVVKTKADTLAAYRARYKAKNDAATAIASKTRSAATAEHIDDTSTDSKDRKIFAVIIKSKKTRRTAIASKTRSAAAAEQIDDSSTDSEKTNSQEAAAASQMDSDALVAFIARRMAKHADIRANVPATVESKKRNIRL